MKKIILLLFLLLFNQTFLYAYLDYNSSVSYKSCATYNGYWYGVPSYAPVQNDVYYNYTSSPSDDPMPTAWAIRNYGDNRLTISRRTYYVQTTSTNYSIFTDKYDQGYTTYLPDGDICTVVEPTCSDDMVVDAASNTCVCKSGTFLDINGSCSVPICDGLNNYLLPDGSCSGCSMLDFTTDANCICSAFQSSYTPDVSMSVKTTIGDFIYDQNFFSCDNGENYTLYENPVPIDGSSPSIDLNITGDTNTTDTNVTASYTDDDGNTISIDSSLAAVSNILSDKLNSVNTNLGSKLDSVNNGISAMNNNLGGKLDSANSKLGDVGDKLDTLNGDNFTGDLSLDSITDFYNKVTTDLDTAEQSYTDFKTTLSDGFPDPAVSSGTDPSWTMDFHGTEIKLDLCSSFSTFRPILTFFVMIAFFLLSIRIFWEGSKL